MAEMSRRSFVRASLIGGAVGAVLPAAKGWSADAAPVRAFEFEDATVAQLQAAMESGRSTSAKLTAAYLARIAEIDSRGPELRAFIELNPDAPADAAALDAERRAKGVRGPLHGIPILIKDNVDVAGKMSTTAGSMALAGWRPPQDAFVAARLRAAGAVILGKTNLSEWANFRSPRSSSGWSGRGGQVRNPYALDRSPSGSSSGTAAAVSASLCAAGVGSETDGSIVSPSSVCSLVGLKPTVGLVSRSGIIPISATQDTAGPMGRCVADVAAMLGVMTGVDDRDPASAAARGKAAPDYRAALDPNGLKGARIGVARARFFGSNPAVDKVVEAAIDAIRKAGATVVDPADLATAGKFDDSELEVLLYEFKDGLDRYLGALPADAPVRSLQALIAFNEQHRDREMPFFGQELLVRAAAKGPLTDQAYLDALAKDMKLSRDEGIDATLAKDKLDAIVAPTGGLPWLIDWVNGDAFTGSSSTPAAVAGYPSVTVPAGYVFGLPVGISFIGAAWSEATLLKFAFAFEHATNVRKPPRFRARADVENPTSPRAA